MPAANGVRSGDGRRGPIKGRALLRGALEHALKRAGTTHATAARWLKHDVSTLRRWLAGTHRIDVEAVVESRKLGRHFCTCLALAEKRLTGGR